MKTEVFKKKYPNKTESGSPFIGAYLPFYLLYALNLYAVAHQQTKSELFLSLLSEFEKSDMYNEDELKSLIIQKAQTEWDDLYLKNLHILNAVGMNALFKEYKIAIKKELLKNKLSEVTIDKLLKHIEKDGTR